MRQQQLDAERERIHWEEVDFVVNAFLPHSGRNHVIGRQVVDLIRCYTIMEMSTDELELLQNVMRHEGMTQTVTADDLLKTARLYWDSRGLDAEKVLAEATAKRDASR
jgi:hypothetical protein